MFVEPQTMFFFSFNFSGDRFLRLSMQFIFAFFLLFQKPQNIRK